MLFQKQQLHWFKQAEPNRTLPPCSPGPAKLAFLIWRGQPGQTTQSPDLAQELQPRWVGQGWL